MHAKQNGRYMRKMTATLVGSDLKNPPKPVPTLEWLHKQNPQNPAGITGALFTCTVLL